MPVTPQGCKLLSSVSEQCWCLFQRFWQMGVTVMLSVECVNYCWAFLSSADICSSDSVRWELQWGWLLIVLTIAECFWVLLMLIVFNYVELLSSVFEQCWCLCQRFCQMGVMIGLTVHCLKLLFSVSEQFWCLFQRFRQMGAMVTTSEAVLLQLVGDKDHPKFKDVQALIKVSAPLSGLISGL